MVSISQQHQRQRRFHQGRYGLWWCHFELLNGTRVGKTDLCTLCTDSYVLLYELVDNFFLVKFEWGSTHWFLISLSYVVYKLSLID